MDKAKVADHFEVEPDAVVNYYEVDGGANIRALIDYGIGGVKVYVVPKSSLTKPKKAKPKPPPEVVAAPVQWDDPEPEVVLADFKYSELQALAREKGIAANQSRAKLIAALE